MFEIHRPSPWSRRAPDMPPVLDERAWLGRRELVRALGLGGMAALWGTRAGALGPAPGLAGAAGAGQDDKTGTTTTSAYPASTRWVPAWEPAGGASAYPARRNDRFEGGRAITPEDVAARETTFYEFLPGKSGGVFRLAEAFSARPWRVQIGGLVESPRAVDLDDIARCAPLEERIYRFRCVESWSMVVPWTGIPMAAFIDWCKPRSNAAYVLFTSFFAPTQAPGFRKDPSLPWPYREALRIDEARNPLALIATGIYGHGLPAQHGAPLRAIVPWKYGYKSPKSFVRVDFVEEPPDTFWNALDPVAYPFLSNVDPLVPHPRWSQVTERDLASGDTLPTLAYNGYEKDVLSLYRD